MRTTVKLHGWLGKKYGKTFKMSVQTPSQAIGLLKANFKDFANDVINFKGAGYRVHIGKEVIDKEELCSKSGGKTIHIIPVVCGSGGAQRIIAGVIIIVAAYFLGPAGAGAAASISAGTASTMTVFGASMILGGVMQLLTPMPKSMQFSSENANNRPSYMFTGPINTVGQGNPVPVLYGKLLVGSQVISAGFSTRQIA